MQRLADYQCNVITNHIYSLIIMIHKIPEGYEKKFAGLIRICTEAKTRGSDNILVTHPRVLGDNYDEVIESLSRLADAGLQLRVFNRKGLSQINDEASRNLPKPANIYHFKN